MEGSGATAARAGLVRLAVITLSHARREIEHDVRRLKRLMETGDL